MALTGVAALAVGLISATLAPAQAVACTTSSLGVPSCGALWGVTVAGQSTSALDTLQTQIGRRFNLVYDFHSIGDRVPTAAESAEVAAGQALHINLQAGGYSYAQIAAGAADKGLVGQAAGVASLHKPVFVTFEHEPDAKPNLVKGSGAQFVAAWRHIYALFRAHGATNAVWVWVVTGWKGNFGQYKALWPGNSYVDWISWDPYGGVNCAPNPVLTGTFASVTAPMYDWIKTTGPSVGIDPTKPEMLSEYAVEYSPSQPSAQGQWLAGIPSALAADFPRVKALAYWDVTGGNCRYLLTTSHTTLTDFAQAGHAGYVNP